MRNLISSRLIVALGASALALPLATSTASAQPAGNQATAEKAYTDGDALFQLRKYDEAAKKFMEAYEAWPVAEFLYNIAQSFRLAGNCEEALYYYERFKKIKKRDGETLEAERVEKIDRFIEELKKCVEQTKTTKTQDPVDINKPKGNDPTHPDDKNDPSKPKDPKDPDKKDVAVVDPDVDDPDDPEIRFDEEAAAPKLLSVRATGGIAMISAGDLEVPVQPAFNLTGGYPLAAGPVLLDLGAAFTYSPVPYENTMNGQSESASLLGLMANVGVTYPVTPQIGLRGDLGIGVLSMGGLVQGDPFTMNAVGATGSLGMLHVRFGVAADYAFTPNLFATLTPFSFAYSPTPEDLRMTALSHIDFLVGVGYRM